MRNEGKGSLCYMRSLIIKLTSLCNMFPYHVFTYIFTKPCSVACHYWQWSVLIKRVKCYFLCVLRWLMRPILVLYCLLQIQQERSEEDSSVGDALALAFHCARFCSASLIRFASYSPAPHLMRPRHFARSFAICSYDSLGMLKSLREALRMYRFLTTMGAFSHMLFSVEDFLWQTFISHSGNMACPS